VFSLLPRGMWIGEPDSHVQPAGELFVTSHFAASVIGDGLAHTIRHVPHLAGEAFESGRGVAAFHPAEHDVAGLSLDERTDGRSVEGALDEVAFPVTGRQPLLDLFRAVPDTEVLGHHGATGGCASPARAALAALLPQHLDHLLAKRALGVGVDRRVDGLVTDLLFGVVWMHALESALLESALPKSLVEAAACGRAVVTTDVPGCRDAIEPGTTGLLVPARDADSLADAIAYLIEHPTERRAMGAAGRALAEREFAIEKIVEQHLTIYRELEGADT